ncbi:MAG: N-acetylglucosamine-6-phosphate deacetylase [Acidimicrobiia bacterium]|nr:MAG: N-acetylglucosamine-6-phosphate deacetylase [Acidimicrobiia bacterium]
MRKRTHGPTAGNPTDHKHVTIAAGGRVVTPGGIIRADLTIEDGKITEIGEPRSHHSGTVVDVADLLVAPGFIDLQVNGGFGHDFTRAPETIWEVGARLPASGVTAFLPTIITSPLATIVRGREVVANGPPPGYLGAVPLGLHLEGPMISPQKPGAHDPAGLQAPGSELVDGWSPDGHVRMVTLAPELRGANALIEILSERGVVVSLGHSDASYDQAIEAISRGAGFGTHLYNAMPPFHHRTPGLVGALLSDPNMTVGIIVDGVHLHPGAVQMAWQAKKPDRLVLVSDAMAAMGMGYGTFDLGAVEVVVDETGPRNLAGDLAGSTLSYDQAFRNLIATIGCSVVEAIAVSSTNPAGVLRDPGRGKLEVGARGDVVAMDSDCNVKATLVAGRIAFAAADVAVKPI